MPGGKKSAALQTLSLWQIIKKCFIPVEMRKYLSVRKGIDFLKRNKTQS